MARKPKSKADSVNPEIDDMLRKMREGFDKMPAEVQLNVIKVAITWEKTKHGLVEGGDGGFFSANDDEND